MSNGVAISVILRTLERNERLSEALESLVNQTRRDFEVVVVDMNKSNTAPVLERFYTQLPQLRHLQIGKPLPRAEALNEGISHAAADKIAILDDDNLYDPIHLAVLVEGLERTGADLVYTGVRGTTYTPTGHLMDVAIWHRPYDFTQLLLVDYIPTSGTAFWKRTWERLGGYDPRFLVGEDYEFLLRVAATGRIECLPAITAESRSFTGTPGRKNHALETRNLRRCRAGRYWLHRDLFFAQRRHTANAAYAYLKARRVAARRSRSGVLIRGLRFCGAMVVGLLDWWYHALLYRKRKKTA